MISELVERFMRLSPTDKQFMMDTLTIVERSAENQKKRIEAIQQLGSVADEMKCL